MSNIASALADALALHRAGDWQRAEALYRQILEANPSQPDALHFLGLIAHQTGRHEAAVDLMRRSIALVPHKEGFHVNLGMAYLALCKLDEAAASYREALRLRPQYAEAHFGLASTLKRQGLLDDAVASYRQAVALRPDFAPAHHNLANTLVAQHKFEEAIARYRQALRIDAGHALARANLGQALLAEADRLQNEGRLEAAVARYRQCLEQQPDCAQAHNNLANTYARLGSANEAVACYRQALRFMPDNAEIHYNLGLALLASAEAAEAITNLRRAVRLKPDMAAAHASLGMVLSDREGQVEEAVQCLEEALRLEPDDRLRLALATRLPAIYQSTAELTSWRQKLLEGVRNLRDRNASVDVTEQPAPHVFYLAYQGLNDRDIMRDLANLYRPAHGESNKPANAYGGAAGAKIRVGLISAFFLKHTIGQWMKGLVAQLARSAFDVTVLSVGNHRDEVAQFIRSCADHFLEVPTHLPSARRLIADLQLDVLLYTDIGMEPITYTLALSRLAPVQCATLGHPVTTGMDTIDYFISAEDLETPESDQHYTEKLIRLPSMPIYFYRPAVPATMHDRGWFNLGRTDHVYACLQSPFKLHSDFDHILGGILRGDPRGILLLSQGQVPRWEQDLHRRFAVTLTDVIDRIRFFPMLGYGDYLNLLAISDVQLDPTPFGGGSTSYDAFAVGLPVVTMASHLLRGRITLALYRQMQIHDCVANDPREYIAIALRLGTDAESRQALRNRILAASAVLWENSAGVRALEAFLQSAITTHRKATRKSSSSC
jgi:predicted O-linked N-acetylglucosamine transferase (SPINDLY family)